MAILSSLLLSTSYDLFFLYLSSSHNVGPALAVLLSALIVISFLVRNTNPTGGLTAHTIVEQII